MENIRKIQTQFMQGNKTTEVFHLLAENYGMGVICGMALDYEDAIFSDGFISAIENGLIPQIGSEHLSFERKLNQEYHHVIFENECYVVYFITISELN